MAIFNTALGMNVKDNPVRFSPFVLNSTVEQATPPPTEDSLLTESGEFILTENGQFLSTE